MTDYADLEKRLRAWATGDTTLCEDLREAADALASRTRELEEARTWQPMETAPTDGRPCYVIGRYTYATAGFPQDAHCYDGKWIDAQGNELVCWGWMARPESWPAEPDLSRDRSDLELRGDQLKQGVAEPAAEPKE